MRRRRWLGLSVAVALIGTAAIMLAGGYYRGAEMLAMQIPALFLPIAAPLLLASLAPAGRAWLWTIALLILIGGWGYVVYIDTRPYQGGGASLAAVLGWMASGVALCVVIVWTIAARIASTVADPRWRRPASGRRE